MNIFKNNKKDFFKINKIVFMSVVLSWLLVMVSCSPVGPGDQESIVTEVAKISVNDGSSAYDQFGQAIAIDKDTAIVSAEGERAAYIFTRDGNNWIQQAKLTESSRFASSVAISGDTVVVGAYDNDSAYIFIRDGSNWTRQAKLTSGQSHKHSVAIDGDTVIIGSAEELYGVDGFGSAHIFTRNGSNWTRQAWLAPNDTSEGSHRFFGKSVAISGDTVIVGAYGNWKFSIADLNSSRSYLIKGFAYVFVRDGNNWVQQAKLEDKTGEWTDRFGWSVSIDGDTAVVGAYQEGEFGHGFQTGSAFIFNRQGTNWTEQAKIRANDYTTYDQFGYSVAIDGNTAVVGATGDDVNGADSGSVYVFTRSGESWNQSSKFSARDSALFSHFGKSIAVDGDNIAIGATEYLAATNGNRFGLTYIFQMNK